MKNQIGYSTRRGFVRKVAASGAAAAASASFFNLMASESPQAPGVSPETSDGKSKYGKCIVKLPVNKMGAMSMFSAGATILNGFPCNIIFAYGTTTGIVGMSKEPHVHDHDEVVYFIGSDPKDVGDLGAEVNMKIGPKGQEEDHIFSVATAVVIPKGVWHCPMVCLKLTKPFLCMAVSLTTKYEVRYGK
jgi:hypothetical protein